MTNEEKLRYIYENYNHDAIGDAIQYLGETCSTTISPEDEAGYADDILHVLEHMPSKQYRQTHK